MVALSSSEALSAMNPGGAAPSASEIPGGPGETEAD